MHPLIYEKFNKHKRLKIKCTQYYFNCQAYKYLQLYLQLRAEDIISLTLKLWSWFYYRVVKTVSHGLSLISYYVIFQQFYRTRPTLSLSCNVPSLSNDVMHELIASASHFLFIVITWKSFLNSCGRKASMKSNHEVSSCVRNIYSNVFFGGGGGIWYVQVKGTRS